MPVEGVVQPRYAIIDFYENLYSGPLSAENDEEEPEEDYIDQNDDTALIPSAAIPSSVSSSSFQSNVSNISRSRFSFDPVTWPSRIRRAARLFYHFMQKETNATLLFLTITGLSVAVVALFVEALIEDLISFRASSIANLGWAGRFFIWLLLSCILAFSSAVVVHLLGPLSAGSGIPEVKGVLAGIVIHGVLSLKTLIAKVLGLVFAIASGLSIGREGPFVHIAAAIAHQWLRLPIFKTLRRNDFLRMQLIAASCGAAVSACFGAPFGGVLFSIEVTSTYFIVSKLWKSLWCSAVGAILTSIAKGMDGNNGELRAFFPTNFSLHPYSSLELLAIGLLGVVCGLAGALFVKAYLEAGKWKKRFKLTKEGRYIPVLIVCAITTLISYPFGGILKASLENAITLLFDDGITTWYYPNLYLNLILFIIIKFILTIAAIQLPIPCGTFIPLLSLGAGLGRLFGACLSSIIPSLTISPAGYAVAGAAGMTSGATRKLCISVIVLEMTGQLGLILPVLVATVVAATVGNQINIGIYDALMRMRGLPLMEVKEDKDLMHLSSVDLMHVTTANNTLTLSTSVAKAEDILLQNPNSDHFPLVDSMESCVLKGSVNRSELEKIIEKASKLSLPSLADVSASASSSSFASSSPIISFIPRQQYFASLRRRILSVSSTVIEIPSIQPHNNNNQHSILDETEFSVSSAFVAPKSPPSTPAAVISSASSSSQVFMSPFSSPPVHHNQRHNNSSAPVVDLSAGNGLWLPYNSAPFIAEKDTPAAKIHFCFVVLGLSEVFVVHEGKMLGSIPRSVFTFNERSDR